jgi:cytochrome P450
MNFKNPDDFVLERWVNNPGYSSDDLFASQPFGYGPEMCPGKVGQFVYTSLFPTVD